MRLMAASDDLRFQCYVLEQGDAAQIQASFVDSFDHAQIHYMLGMVGGRQADDPKNQKFILWDAQQEAIIGYARIYRPLHCVFTGDYIVEKMRGRHLIDLLYAGRLRFLHEEGYAGEIIIHTGKENGGTRGAAIRNGFSVDAEEQDNWTFQRNIDVLNHDPTLERARTLFQRRFEMLEISVG